MGSSLPRGVVALGLVSLFMDMSSEMIHALLPLYLTGVLGVSALAVGLIEGAGEALAQAVKLVSGGLSDRMARRKPLVVAGYALSALTKPLFALAGSPGLVLGARLADRLGKGLRGAPRDALVADMVPPEARGAAYGLRQSLDSVGALTGPLLAVGLMLALQGNIPLIFVLATVPAAISVAILVLVVREPERRSNQARPRMDWRRLGDLGQGMRWVLVLAGLMTLARISEAFLILRAGELGLDPGMAPLALVGMNFVYVATSWPSGRLSDRIGRAGLFRASLVILILADLCLGLGSGLVALVLGTAFWGLHMGLSQGILSAMVADAAPKDLRGTAFGLFHITTGAALLLGNAAAGALWAGFGATAAFCAGAAVASLALLLGMVRRGT